MEDKIEVIKLENKKYKNVVYNDFQISEKDLEIFKNYKLLNIDLNRLIYIDFETTDGKQIRKFTNTKSLGIYDTLSSEEIEIKNILEKNPKEILSQIHKVISSMEVDESFKNILKNFYNETNVEEKTPFLIYNEKEKKKQWYLPKAEGEKGIFLDYESEVPYFSSEGQYIQNFYYSDAKEMIVISKEGMKSQVHYLTENENNGLIYEKIVYTNNNLPKGFVFYPTKHDLISLSNLHYFVYQNNKISLPCFDLGVLKEEETIDLLKKVKSNKEIEEVKLAINERINDYENKWDNNTRSFTLKNYQFIYEKYDYLENINGKKNEKKYIANLQTKDIRHINLERLMFESIEIKNNINYLKINSRLGLTVLPKDNGKFDNDEKNNFIRMISNNDLFVEGKMLVITPGLFAEKNYIIDFTDKVKNLKITHKRRINDFNFRNTKENKIFLFSNYDDELFLINLFDSQPESLGKQKKIKNYSKDFINFLNIENRISNSNSRLMMLSLDKEIISLYKTTNQDDTMEKIEKHHTYLEEDGSIKIKTKLPFLKKGRKLNKNVNPKDLNKIEKEKLGYETNINIEIELNDKKNNGSYNKEYYINENGELDFNIPSVSGLKKIDLEYHFNSLENLDKLESFTLSEEKNLLKEYTYQELKLALKNVKIDKFTIDKENYVKFMDKTYFNRIKSLQFFNLEIKDKSLIMENLSGNTMLLNNLKNNVNVVLNKEEESKKDILTSNVQTAKIDLIKEKFQTNKVYSIIKNKFVEKDFLVTDNALMILSDEDFNLINDFNYKKTINKKNTLLTDENSLNFYNEKNELMYMNFDKNLKFKNITNIQNNIDLKNKINSYGLSF